MKKIFRVSGLCWSSDCNCNLHDGEEINEGNKPPLHDGCTCYIEEIEKEKNREIYEIVDDIIQELYRTSDKYILSAGLERFRDLIANRIEKGINKILSQ